MPTPTKGPRLGGSPAHERLMLANLATALFEHGRITTTEAKAKRLRPLAERLITFAKRGDLHARRQVLTVVTDKGVVHDAVHRDRPALREPARRLHPDHQDRPAQGRQRPVAVIELVGARPPHRQRRPASPPRPAGGGLPGDAAGRGHGRRGGRRADRRGRRAPPRTPRPWRTRAAAEDAAAAEDTAEAAERHRRGRG